MNRIGCTLMVVAALWGTAAARQAPGQPQAPAPPAQSPLSPPEAAPLAPAHIDFAERGHGMTNFFQRFSSWKLPTPDFRNAAEIEAAGAGTLYLTLHDTLELALANDLDIASAGYSPLINQTDLFRALAGGASRGVAGAGLSNTVYSNAIGASNGGSSSGGTGGTGSVTGGSSGVHGGCGGYDPTITTAFADEHAKVPLNSSLLYGVPVEIQNDTYGYVGYCQGFSTGTSLSLSGFSLRNYINSTDLFYNPSVASDVSVGVSQSLLAGANRQVNRIFILSAQATQNYADALYRQKVEETVAAAAEKYWALAAAQKQVAIAQDAESEAQQVVDDTTELVRQGKVPGQNLVQAQEALNNARRERIQDETDTRKTASELKLFLARQWSGNLALERVVASEPLPELAAPAQPPEQMLIQRAVSASPVLAEQRANIANDEFTVTAKRAGLAPALSVYASYTSDGLAGVEQQCVGGAALPCAAGMALPPVPSGLAKSYGQVWNNNAPDYGVGFNFSFNVFNGQARADQARAELELAQAKVDLQNQTNQVAQHVDEARIDLEGDAAQLEAARAAADLAQRALGGEQDKYTQGRNTVADVVAAESALEAARKSVMAAQQAYANAQVELARASGTILDDYHIVIRPAGSPPTPR